MKKEYDFSKAKQGAVVPSNKLRISIRLDADIIEHFKRAVEDAGGGNYQTSINAALHEYISGKNMAEILRKTVQDAIHSELKKAA